MRTGDSCARLMLVFPFPNLLRPIEMASWQDYHEAIRSMLVGLLRATACTAWPNIA